MAERPASRLMVLDRSAAGISHHVFHELPGLLRKGDLLVVNNTKVLPAKFFCRRSTGGKIEGLFLRELSAGLWQVLLKGASRCRVGERLSLVPPEAEIELAVNEGQGQWQVKIVPPVPAADVLEKVGQTPLPPYIRRKRGLSTFRGRCEKLNVPFSGNGDMQLFQTAEKQQVPISQVPIPDDADRYQTVYAERAGAVAAPTAGLHFTPELLAELQSRGIETARVTLHVGMGTFLPVKADDLTQHTMHREWYELSPAAADAINAARREGRRVVAVGTTSVRVLESVAREMGADKASPFFVQPASGWTDIFIYPPYKFRVVDALITNFHLPRSTLLMLVSAFASPAKTDGLSFIQRAYALAQQERYRFFSYGDAMLIE